MAFEVGSNADVQAGLGRAQEQVGKLEKHSRTIQTHFQQALTSVGEISHLCDDAEASVKRSQTQLNRATREMHVLNERVQLLLAGVNSSQPSPAPSSPERVGGDENGRKKLQQKLDQKQELKLDQKQEQKQEQEQKQKQEQTQDQKQDQKQDKKLQSDGTRQKSPGGGGVLRS
eukprot:TRINITY_DN12096_c0_g7_i1.p1 TRINITY_DN12096_c0_g7~~TRINITY_DN12096_c0_g7_i1.p1  ORF type:complete len:173 (+),score=53.50 TRINITY_DN12096_c0_g7_i1:284-802(+)